MMNIVHAPARAPITFSSSVFLAGPSDAFSASWQADALRLLAELGYDGLVLVPRALTSEGMPGESDSEWETEHLNLADIIVAWIPTGATWADTLCRHHELPVWRELGKVIVGGAKGTLLPPRSMGPGQMSPGSLTDTLKAAIAQVEAGEERSGGERNIPLYLWRLPHFQGWLQAQKQAGNRLESARLLWAFWVGPRKETLLAYAVRVEIHVDSENRVKSNEFILGRPDISHTILYRRHESVRQSEIALIREFRSTSSTEDGFIHEAPGGSSLKPEQNPRAVALEEIHQEVRVLRGILDDPTRLIELGSRQLMGTFSVHRAHLFACEVSASEMAILRRAQHEGITSGVKEESEHTHIELHTFGDLLDAHHEVDWSTLGMIAQALLG